MRTTIMEKEDVGCGPITIVRLIKGGTTRILHFTLHMFLSFVATISNYDFYDQ